MMIELAAAAMLLANMDPEGVVTTAPRGDQAVLTATDAMLADTTTDASPSTTVQSAAPHGLTTDQQIARWIGERTANAPEAPVDPWAEADAGPRKMHGQVSVGVGTGGYRDYAAAVSMPLGENATLNLSISQTKNSPWGYYGYGYGSPWTYPYAGRPFGMVEPFGYEGADYRGRTASSLRARDVARETTNSAGVSLEIGR